MLRLQQVVMERPNSKSRSHPYQTEPSEMTRKIAVIVGSPRKDSFNRKIARAIAEESPSDLAFTEVQITDLPFYDPDLDTDTPPEAWVRARKAVAEADGVLFLTAEYNRSVPGVLKNAIDVLSRPYGKSVLTRKPVGVISSSPGAIGGFGANHALRQMLLGLNPAVMQGDWYLGGVHEWFDGEGRLVLKDKRDFLARFAGEFADWVRTHSPAARAAAA